MIFHLSQIPKNKMKKGSFLKPGDIVIIRLQPKRKDINRVQIEGYVNFPGTYLISNQTKP